MNTNIPTNRDRINSLMTLGYSEREAAFLCLAALHGGFFLRRQFLQFSGISSGAADAALLDKLLAKRHGTAILGCQKAVIYHISARPFYRAIWQENNRNRRMRPPVSIKNRLMGLDYVLGHAEHRYFATEEEKIAYFADAYGIDPSALPEKAFTSPKADEATSRFFVDKYPVYVRQDSTSKPVVGFCYIDEGAATLSRFGAYLVQYRRLFSRLPTFEMVYVSISRSLLWEAERHFNHFVSGQPKTDPVALNTSDVPRLLGYFKDRQKYEAGPDRSFDRAKLIRFRDDRLEFAGTFFESLYFDWKTGGERAIQAALPQKRSWLEPLNGTFSTCLLRHNYDLFGTVMTKQNAEPWADQD